MTGSTDQPPTGGTDNDRGGVSAGWVVALVILLTLGLGAAFFIVANSQPVELVEQRPSPGQAQPRPAAEPPSPSTERPSP